MHVNFMFQKAKSRQIEKNPAKSIEVCLDTIKFIEGAGKFQDDQYLLAKTLL